jgi:hypothetical protein
MVIPAVMLVILALVAIRSLMGVVAHEDVATSMALSHEPVRGVWADDARSLLLPAADAHLDLRHAENAASGVKASSQ